MKRKIIIYSVLLGLLLIMTGVGIFDLVIKTKYKNNEITFRVQNDDVFFVANASYYYGDVSEATKTFNLSYSQGDYYKGKVCQGGTWNIGNSQFVYDDNNPQNNITLLKYVFSIKNINDEKKLNVKLSNVAANKNNYFITTISYKNGTNDRVMFSNNPNNEVNKKLYYNEFTTPYKVDISTNEYVKKEQTLEITITLELIKVAESFNVSNNFSLELASVLN